VAIADFSKNLYASYAACSVASTEVVALVDDGPAFQGMTYRKRPIVGSADLPRLDCDGVVVSNTNPAQVAARAERLAQVTRKPVLTLWQPRYMDRPGPSPLQATTTGARAA
jgi:hypothetical protein